MKNEIIPGVFVQTPAPIDFWRGIWGYIILSIALFFLLYFSKVEIMWCIIAFLFIGPLSPRTLYALHLPYGIEFQATSIIVYYSFLGVKKKKIIQNERARFCFFNKNHPKKRPRLVLHADKSWSFYRTVAFVEAEHWSLADQKKVLEYAEIMVLK